MEVKGGLGRAGGASRDEVRRGGGGLVSRRAGSEARVGGIGRRWELRLGAGWEGNRRAGSQRTGRWRGADPGSLSRSVGVALVPRDPEEAG